MPSDTFARLWALGERASREQHETGGLVAKYELAITLHNLLPALQGLVEAVQGVAHKSNIGEEHAYFEDGERLKGQCDFCRALATFETAVARELEAK